MVAFNFNVDGHDFERGLMILRDSLTAALQALDLQREKVGTEYDEYNAGLARGEPAKGDFDEESETWIWEQSQFYDYDLELIEETKGAIRKTHATAIYHLWERVVRNWTGSHGRETHDMLVEKLVEKGLTVDERMKTISHLNNALKHNSHRFGPLLLAAWPEVFPADYADQIERQKQQATDWKERGHGNGEFWPDWFDRITLTDADMDTIFDVVRRSGPRANTPF
tara:strand:- start:3820 stop:4494 length:675 start_codon:yes stop_codon:yes gene_type:complete